MLFEIFVAASGNQTTEPPTIKVEKTEKLSETEGSKPDGITLEKSGQNTSTGATNAPPSKRAR